ncbi:MAG: DNA/RNA non-specific endonuclease [Agitococcus sp.]|nr:DNA/RNA non-specific endonuclease [Agitococcus sp.]
MRQLHKFVLSFTIPVVILACVASAPVVAYQGPAIPGAFKECPQFFVNGAVPIVSSDSPGLQRALCFDAFAILHSGQSKTPVYVVEKLNRANLADAKGRERTNRFYEEARLPFAERAQLADYKSTDSLDQHYDRGHQSPAADQPTMQAMVQSFSLANMAPQAPENNRGIWAKSVEKPTRQYVARAQGDVYVFTGPHFVQPIDTLGPGKVWIPRQLFKLVYDATTHRAWAYWAENTNDAKMSRPISYRELVARTGIEFLPGVAVLP